MASLPVVYSLVADTWTIVAANVTYGVVTITDPAPSYLETHVPAGGAAPTTDALARPVSQCDNVISSDAGIDVYIKSVSVAGEVRVDL